MSTASASTVCRSAEFDVRQDLFGQRAIIDTIVDVVALGCLGEIRRDGQVDENVLRLRPFMVADTNNPSCKQVFDKYLIHNSPSSHEMSTAVEVDDVARHISRPGQQE